MNTILLEPTDVLFFRDGRPMGGASSGHGAAWPLPNVISHAFHAALHRAEFNGVHVHRRGRSGDYVETRDRKFGSLVTAGPFPVHADGESHTWFFPRPLDSAPSGKAGLFPIKNTGASSLPKPLLHPVASILAPTKQAPEPWWNKEAWDSYLGVSSKNEAAERIPDSDFSDTEHTYGIEISPDTGSVVEGRFYSAHYLRLRAGWKLGVFATAPDKDFRHEQHGNDLVRTLLNGHGTEIITGGQQRICTAVLEEPAADGLPLPLGRNSGFGEHEGKHLVKWVLLTPAIFPAIEANPDKNINAHPGGWLPNWIAAEDQNFEGEPVPGGAVLLLDGPGKEKARRKKLPPGKRINARLVAATVGKPLPVTGWALPNESDPDRQQGGAKSTHLAVPAGAVYYFEAASEAEATRLAAALNWHGSETQPRTIHNRRSTLMGEKGLGLGVCGTWSFHRATAH